MDADADADVLCMLELDPGTDVEVCTIAVLRPIVELGSGVELVGTGAAEAVEDVSVGVTTEDVTTVAVAVAVEVETTTDDAGEELATTTAVVAGAVLAVDLGTELEVDSTVALEETAVLDGTVDVLKVVEVDVVVTMTVSVERAEAA